MYLYIRALRELCQRVSFARLVLFSRGSLFTYGRSNLFSTTVIRSYTDSWVLDGILNAEDWVE